MSPAGTATRPSARPDRAWAEAWQASWDRQQEGYMPDRELRFAALLDVVEAVAGPRPLVLDLACGTGSITRRLLDRFPGARSIAVDIDPALLTIAGATFAGDERVRIVRADLASPDWTHALPETPVDAVVTATALHWIPEPMLRRLYRDLAGVVRPGGVAANVDHMVTAELPRLAVALRNVEERHRERQMADGRPGWAAWWDLAAADPLLAEAVAERNARFPADHLEFDPPSQWHADALRDAGFAESGVTWRSGNEALVAAVR
ncbi:MAG TPA: class I SAM-dependent methyltransferase [Acidimicrobiales bacterium]|nr:class I SAM-dependent methyltransferase [Acidimicrobiales bacterium]